MYSCDFCETEFEDDKYHIKSKTHILNILKYNGRELTKELKIKYFTYCCFLNNCDFFSNFYPHFDKHKKSLIHNKSEEECKENISNTLKQNHIKGDKIEEYFVELYKKYDEIEEVKRIGQTGNTFDILLKFKNEDNYRCIQIKTIKIYEKKRSIEYRINVGRNKNYKDDTLIVCSNKDFNFFVLIPYEKIKHLSDNISISYTEKGKYYKYSYLIVKNQFFRTCEERKKS